MENSVTSVTLVLGSHVTFTNSPKPLVTGTPILIFFLLVGRTQPLGIEGNSPGHTIVPRLALEVECVEEKPALN